MTAVINRAKRRKTLDTLKAVQWTSSTLFFSFIAFPGAVFVSIYFILTIVLNHFASIDEVMSLIIISMQESDGGTGRLSDVADIAGSRFTSVYYISVAMAIIYKCGQWIINFFFD